MRYAIPDTSDMNEAPRYYVDLKRHWWYLSLFVPLLTVIGPACYMLFEPSIWFLTLPFFILYGSVPIGDYFIGTDQSNPPESVVPQLENDPYYRLVTLALVPILWASFLFAAWFVGTQSLTVGEYVLTSFSSALICGFGLNVAHEMGHKKNPVDQWCSKAVLAIGAYGHFFIEHNRGHHKEAATVEDCASSKMGESIYRFMLREISGGIVRAWQLEKSRLQRKGEPVWSLKNEFLQPLLITFVLYTTLLMAFGAVMIPFLIIVMWFGAFQLTSANYIEHYGLLREKLPSGDYERCQPRHSWNSNHKLSNWILFHLQRHSDHHANPARHYQSLRHFEDAPQLPNGYAGMFLLAYLPPLWRKVMDPKVMEWAKGDLNKVNLYEPKRNDLYRKYAHLSLGAHSKPNVVGG